MAREIKFRAWEKSLQEIIPVHDIDFSSRQINTNGAWRLFNEVELMQYTGLKDNSGREIYEGDIISIYELGIYEVIFKEGCFGAEDWVGFSPFRGTIWGYGGVVIGNVYENPELLEPQP